MTGTPLRQANKILVPVSELAVGMCVCELDRPWLESPFWFQGFPLQSQEDGEEVQRVCRHVFIDGERSTQSCRKRLARLEKAEATQVKQRTIKASALAQGSVKRLVTGIRERLAQRLGVAETVRSIRVAQHAFDQTARYVHDVIERTRAGQSIDIRSGRETVAGCVDHVTRHHLDLARQDPSVSAQLSVARILSQEEAGIDTSVFPDQDFLRRVRQA